MTPRVARSVVGVGVPAALAAVAVGPLLVLRDRLPDRVASHYDFSGTPDDSMTLAQFAVVCGVLVVIGIAVLVWMATSSDRMPAPMAPTLTFVGAFVAGLGAAILASTVITQRDLVDWRDASNGTLATAFVIGAGVAFGAVAAWPASSLPHAIGTGTTTATPPMPLTPGEHAVWVSTMHSRWLQWCGAALATGGAVAAVVATPVVALILVPAAVAMLALATVRVRVDADGVVVRYGLLAHPRTRIPIERIDHASAIDVRPLEWGGWGYRGSVSLMRQAAVVLRKGPGLRLDLVGGRVFVVTVDGPEVPASLLNAEVARRTG